MLENEKYDLTYIGTGPILVLDALNETLKGNRVLMIDSSNEIGGAWKLINLYGLEGIENAVHYLVPNNNGYLFLENYLGTELVKTTKKYYAHKIFSKPFLFQTSNFFGKFINYFRKNNNLYRIMRKRLRRMQNISNKTIKMELRTNFRVNDTSYNFGK